ncbi:MAG: YaaA family protein [Actinomycetota bacterium]
MIILLPPSETKRPGGLGPPLSLTALSFPQLTQPRRSALAAVRRLSTNLKTAAHALGLGTRSAPEAALNRQLRSAATMAALDRFDGVLFDALNVAGLTPQARRFAEECVVIHSALFGLVRAGDEIPNYRLSCTSRLPNATLRSLWREPITAVLAAGNEFVLDLRSAAYVSLGPAGVNSYGVRVVTKEAGGARRGLNHFGKAAKGRFIRALLDGGVNYADVDSLIVGARAAGVLLEPAEHRVLDLVV